MGCLPSKNRDDIKRKQNNTNIYQPNPNNSDTAEASNYPTHFSVEPACNSILDSQNSDNESENQASKELRNSLDGKTIRKDIHTMFTFLEVLGNGHFGNVRKAIKKNSTQKLTYAVKIIPKEKVSETELYLLKTEIEVLEETDHPNIVKFFYTFQDENYFHLVMEHLTGGELLDRIIENKGFDETHAATLVRKIASAINYLHQNNICHRDIKPENFLFSEVGEIKMIDFGLSKKFGDEEAKEADKIMGTCYYLAPEVLTGKYSLACDMWSLGVLVYVLLSGHPPFPGKNDKEIFMNIIFNEPDFSAACWSNVSDIAIDFIKKLLVFEPEDRMSASQAIEHEWLNTENRKENLNPEIIDRLVKYRAPNRLKREALSVMIKYLSDKEIKGLITNFRIMDENQTGNISYHNLENLIREQYKNKLAADEIKDIFKKFHFCEDESDEDTICYTDFIIATMDRKYYSNKDLIMTAFRYFDIDNKGYITFTDIENAFHRQDREIEKEEFVSFLHTSDAEQITFPQFYEMIIKESDSPITKVSLNEHSRILDKPAPNTKIRTEEAEKMITIRKNSMRKGISPLDELKQMLQ